MIGADGRGYVLADRSCKLSPAGWARQAVDAYHEFKADRLIAERNFGGALVEHVIRTAEPNIAHREVIASRFHTVCKTSTTPRFNRMRAYATRRVRGTPQGTGGDAMTKNQKREAIKRRDQEGERLRSIGRSYNVSAATISRLAP